MSADTAFDAGVLALSPTAFWKLDDASKADGAQAADSSGGGNHLAYTGNPTAWAPGAGFAGVPAGVVLDGVGDAVIGADDADWDIATDHLTLGGWFELADPNTFYYLAVRSHDNHVDPYYEYGIGTTGDHTYRTAVAAGGTFVPKDGGVLNAGVKQLLVLTYDGVRQKLYSNGALIQDNARTGNVSGGTGRFGIGTIPAPEVVTSFYLPMKASRVFLMKDAALDAAQVSALYALRDTAVPALPASGGLGQFGLRGQPVSQ